MSLLDKASLIVTPNAVKESKLYSVVPSSGAGDMDVVRATTATRVNSAGLIEVVPRNLVEYSEQFNNSFWTKNRASITANSTNSPNGNLTADSLIEDTSNGTHEFISIIGVNTGNYVYSMFAKANTRTKISLVLAGTPFAGGGNGEAFFNLSTGVVISTSGGATATIQNIGNGWYRCSVSKVSTSADSGVTATRLVDDSNNSSYTGNGTSGAFVFGAQLENFATATEYFPTTTRLNIPRIDYTNGSCPSLLVEPQRTNLVLRSEEFTNVNWEKGTPITLVSNTTETTSPQGINNATKATANGTGLIFIRQAVFSGTTSPTTNSIFVKKANNRYVGFRNGGSGVLHDVFDFNTETWTNNSGSTLSFDRLTNGWYRLKSSRTNTLPNTYISVTIPDNTSGAELTTVSNLTLYLWGGQSELNVLYATSYIPTVASSVTRNADVISKTGISSLIGQTEGTIYYEFSVPLVENITRALSVSGSDTNNRINISTFSSSIFVRVDVGGANQVNSSAGITVTNMNKVALRYKANDFSLYVNGVNVITDTSGITFPAATLDRISNIQPDSSSPFNGTIKQITLFKTALSNTELAQLTTL
jgi:hypothetical protein